MDKEDVEFFIGKTVKVCTDFNGELNSRFYTGVIQKISGDDAFLILDKYDQLNLVKFSEVKFISEVKRLENGGEN